MEKTYPSILKSFVLIGLGMVLALTLSFFLLAYFRFSLRWETVQLVLMLGEISLPIPILLWGLKSKTKFTRLFRLRWGSLNSFVPLFLIAIGLVVLIDTLDRLVQMAFPVPDKFMKIEEFLRISNILTGLIVISVVVIVAPFVEEIIFRGFLQQVLEYWLKDIKSAVVISSMVFTVMHFNIYWAFQIFILALFTGYLAWRCNSIYPSFLIHALNNGFSVLAINLKGKIPLYEWRGFINPIFIIGGVIFFLVGFQWLHRSGRGNSLTE